VLKEAPQLLFTGLTREIGRPRELERNLDEAQGQAEEEQYFNNPDINITIPLEETQQWATLYPIINPVVSDDNSALVEDENQVQCYLMDSQTHED